MSFTYSHLVTTRSFLLALLLCNVICFSEEDRQCRAMPVTPTWWSCSYTTVFIVPYSFCCLCPFPIVTVSLFFTLFCFLLHAPFFLYFTQFSSLNFPVSLVFEGTACGLCKGWSYHRDLSWASGQSCPYVFLVCVGKRYGAACSRDYTWDRLVVSMK
jgi:hypothetical protein